MKNLFPAFGIAIICFFSCNGNDDDSGTQDPTLGNGVPPPTYINYSIIASHPHDTGAFTQGLQLHDGKMYEGTGDNEQSSLRITDHKTGKVFQIHKMGTADIFGEGITILDNKIYQLTWQSNIAYVYDLKDINKPIKTFTWPHEGWGITNNGTDLIISDGTYNLYFVNPVDFKIKSTVTVKSNIGNISDINELEWIDGFIYANIWQTNDIIKINPANGNVVGKMTFDNLLTKEDYAPGDRTDVLNGIAYDTASKTMFITGKRWPKLFEVKMN